MMTVVPQIFVVHGALGSAAQMEPIARALESLGRVHNVELPGHGRTALPEKREFSIATFADALAAAVRQARDDEAPPPIVFGYSMGGYTALSLEAKNPGTFAGILTLGTKFAWDPALAVRESARLDANTIAEKVPKFASVLEERHRDVGGWKLLLERTANLLRGLGDNPTLTRDSVGRVQARVCIAVGERDDTVTIDEARDYAAFITHSRSEIVPDAPHPIERVPADAIVRQMAALI